MPDLHWRRADDRRWETSAYQALVGVRHHTAPGWPPVRTLFVWRKDSRRIGAEHFAVLQSAKNAIFGPAYTAVEVYPPEDELRDRAHIYWLQVLDDPTYRLPWLPRQRRSVARSTGLHIR